MGHQSKSLNMGDANSAPRGINLASVFQARKFSKPAPCTSHYSSSNLDVIRAWLPVATSHFLRKSHSWCIESAALGLPAAGWEILGDFGIGSRGW